MKQLPRKLGPILLFFALFAVACPVLCGMEIRKVGRIAPLSVEEEQAGGAAKWAAVEGLLSIDRDALIAGEAAANLGGNTSIRNQIPLVWKTGGYFRRARDLGQVITIGDADVRIGKLFLRTGPGDLAFLDGAADAEVFVEWLRVEGDPVVNDQGTPPGTKSSHGFTDNHRADDTIDGITYASHAVARGIMPDLRDASGDGTLVYLEIQFLEEEQITLKAGQRYAFLIGFSEAAAERGMTFANYNAAAVPAPAALGDEHDGYTGGWGIRREGNGDMPPAKYPGENPPDDPDILALLRAQASFPDGPERREIMPSCNGFPDVDTYRDYEFYLVAAKR